MTDRKRETAREIARSLKEAELDGMSHQMENSGDAMTEYEKRRDEYEYGE